MNKHTLNNAAYRHASVAVFLSCFLALLVIFATPSASAKNTWALSKHEDGIKVWLRGTPNSSIKTFKGRVEVNTSLSALVYVISETSSYPRWLYNCQSAKTLKRNGYKQRTNYVVTNMPWPVTDRDAIITSSLSQNPSNKRVEIKLLAKPREIPLVAGKVRIQKLHGRWLLTPLPNGNIEVIYEVTADPGGNIPKWIVNSMSIDLPYHTLNNLRAIVKQPEFANAKVPGLLN